MPSPFRTLPVEGTLLILSSLGIPLYSARGLSQQLNPIQGASVNMRDINGILRNMALDVSKKYETKITCTDRRAPAVGGVWPGMIVDIWCVAELNFLTESGSPERTAVSGSYRTEGDFTFYRPILTMMIKGQTPTQTVNEWGADVQWELDAEEV